MASVVEALRRVKGDPARVLKTDQIESACRSAGYEAWRDRTLGPVATVRAMAVQALHGNAPIGEVVRLHKGVFTGPAFCRARKRLPLQVMLALFHEQHGWIMQTITKSADAAGRWRGHRTWLNDSTGFSMPDTPELQEYFGQPSRQKPGCGFPVCRALMLFDWYSVMLMDFIPAPLDTGEGALAPLTHPSMTEGDIVLSDSNFGTFGQIALQMGRGLHALCEVQVSREVSFDWRKPRSGAELVRKISRRDQIVRWLKPEQRPAWMDARQFEALPESITVREVRVRLRDQGSRKREVTLVTTLLDEKKYPARALAELYGRRWRIEDSIRTLKHTLKLDVLRCTSVHGVLKELVTIALVYNMVRMVMLDAAERQKVTPDRISFIDALRWWRWAGPDEPIPILRINPLRPGRHEPRVRKRRAKAYPLMHEPRSVLKARLHAKPEKRAK